MIPFNKPYITGKEMHYVFDAISNGKLSGNGKYTQKCHSFFEERYGFRKVLLTTSCTDALEMCAILADIQPDDEVIIPSYTFVSTALAFIRQGAKVVFADSCKDNPNINVDEIEKLITDKTKAIVPVHYAGVSCDMDKIMALAEQYNLIVIEDAAQAIDGYYFDKKGNKKALGSIGHLAAFSFHETKNLISGEGGMLVVNDERFVSRSEIIWEKGTNRAEFFRGEVNKYGWVDIGSSFLPSETMAAFLWAQIEKIDDIQNKRKLIWDSYYNLFFDLSPKMNIEIPKIPHYSSNNGHIFYITFPNSDKRAKFIEIMKENDIFPVFHYLSLHNSKFYAQKHTGQDLINSDKFSDCLVRLPMYYELTSQDVQLIGSIIKKNLMKLS